MTYHLASAFHLYFFETLFSLQWLNLNLIESEQSVSQGVFVFVARPAPRSLIPLHCWKSIWARKYLSAAASVSVYSSPLRKIQNNNQTPLQSDAASPAENWQTEQASSRPCSDRKRWQSRGKRTTRYGTVRRGTAAPNDLPSVSADWEKPLPPATLPCHPSHGGWLLSPMSTLLQLWLAVLTSLPPPPQPNLPTTTTTPRPSSSSRNPQLYTSHLTPWH